MLIQKKQELIRKVVSVNSATHKLISIIVDDNKLTTNKQINPAVTAKNFINIKNSRGFLQFLTNKHKNILIK